MKREYNHLKIERKWQKKWREEKLYRTLDKTGKPKYYILDMFPYPSGVGLHVGHPKGYIATDIVARKKMMEGYEVLHPMGWDAFGLPAENYALKNKIHPAVATADNVKNFKKQLEGLGFSYDWEREINTTDPNFYKWTQWIFLELYGSYFDERSGRARPIEHLIEHKFGTNDYYALEKEQKAEIDKYRLAFEEYAPINWCPSCKTGLANEDLEDGKCERCGTVVEKKLLRQWSLRITKYAERMLEDLKDLEWEEFIKTMQVNWIGKSEGVEVGFTLRGDKELKEVRVFTTRADTLFGCTYVVMAPEKVTQFFDEKQIVNWSKVEAYIKQVGHKSEMERTDVSKEKTGVELKGVKAINPINGEAVPVWVADYVLGDYGTGVIMAVPAHDERDFEFAKKYKLPIKKVIDSGRQLNSGETMVEDGVLINSGKYSGLTSAQARERIAEELKKNGQGRRAVNYKLREWVFSRQRYWGEPIPIVHCPKCGVVPLPEKDLPLKLPEVEHYEPSGTGESPLAKIKSWVEVKCPHCGGRAKRETNTMPQWAGSSWYYLRFMDPHNNRILVAAEKEQYWGPVDFYVGGAEHATRHLIYARFWHKFLYDLGVVSTQEPFKKLQHVGLILAEDGRKMSKRWGNVINPDEIVTKYGADSMRVYEMFMAPFGSASAWKMQGVVGCRKFLVKVWQLRERVEAVAKGEKLGYETLLHQTIKKVTRDIDEFKLNTTVSCLMILVNKMTEAVQVRKEDFKILIQLLSPLAPHLAEELWSDLGNKKSVFLSQWPEYNRDLARAEMVILPIQINGKLRDQLEVEREVIEQEEKIWELVLAREKVKQYVKGVKVKKKIYVKGRIVNLVVE